MYYTDNYKVYEYLPPGCHKIGKFRKVNRNEGIHSVLRDRLKKLARRIKSYIKSYLMLKALLALICLYLGWIQMASFIKNTLYNLALPFVFVVWVSWGGEL